MGIRQWLALGSGEHMVVVAIGQWLALGSGVIRQLLALGSGGH